MKKKKNREVELKKKLLLYEEEKRIFKDSRDKILREIDAKKRTDFAMLKSQAADAHQRSVEDKKVVENFLNRSNYLQKN